MEVVRTLRKFDDLDIMLTFLEIGHKTVSREELATITEFGEGSIKSMIKILKNNDFVSTEKKGNKLTEKGKKYFSEIYKFISPIIKINQDIFRDNLDCYGCILRKYNRNKQEKLYVARENGIRVGCNSAMILTCENDLLKAQYVEEFNFNFLKKEFDIKNKELLIVTSSNKKTIAEKGILTISCYLNEELNNIVSLIATKKMWPKL